MKKTAFVELTDYGECRCGGCRREIVCDAETGDMPEVCPGCGRMLDWSRFDEQSAAPGGDDVDELLVFPTCRDVDVQAGWKLVRCPRCGQACWLRPEARELLKEQPALVWACSECAAKAGAEERLDCLLCGAEKSVVVTRSSYNGHMRGVCEACGARYME